MRRTVIVVPCYNEARRLDVAQFDAYLGAISRVELLFVNDGSTDATAPLLDELAGRWPCRARVLHLESNVGKAEAVRRGVAAAMARVDVEYVGFWDADLATPLGAILVFVAVLDRLAAIDLVLGARVALLGRAIERDPARRLLGRIFAATASLVLGLSVRDTQCGAKLFRVGPRARALFAEPFQSRWIFDVELLARYLDGGGEARGIYELPVDSWRDVAGSKVRPSDFVRAIGEMAQIFRRYRRTTRARRAVALLTAPLRPLLRGRRDRDRCPLRDPLGLGRARSARRAPRGGPRGGGRRRGQLLAQLPLHLRQPAPTPGDAGPLHHGCGARRRPELAHRARPDRARRALPPRAARRDRGGPRPRVPAQPTLDLRPRRGAARPLKRSR